MTQLVGGLKRTLLSPGPKQLGRLKAVRDNVVADAAKPAKPSDPLGQAAKPDVAKLAAKPTFFQWMSAGFASHIAPTRTWPPGVRHR